MNIPLQFIDAFFAAMFVSTAIVARQLGEPPTILCMLWSIGIVLALNMLAL